MKSRIGFGKYWFFLAALFFPAMAFSLTPMVHYHDLVAGKGDRSFKDGSFTQACFNYPAGLAISPDGKKLFVSDRNNNRIRMVDLEHQNVVSTVAGSGQTGKSDGKPLEATFNQPTAIVYLPEDKLVVYDSGNYLFREIDLKKKIVLTLAGNGSPQGGPRDGMATQVGLVGVGDLAYVVTDKTLYYTQPEGGFLGRILMETNMAQAVVFSVPEPPRPTALCVSGDKLYFSDGGNSRVYRADISANPLTSASVNAALTQIGEGGGILDLAVSGEVFYALQAGNTPCARVNPYSPVSLISVTGNLLDEHRSAEPSFFNFQGSKPIFVSDPLRERRFFFANSNLNAVYSFKDYAFERWKSGNSANEINLSDFDYPAVKPPHTCRILIVGNSMTFVNSQAEQIKWGTQWGLQNVPNRMMNVSKRLEFVLNLWSSLQNKQQHYEVLNAGRTEGTDPLISWPYYYVPELIKKYDIDLVLMVVTCQGTAYYESFYQRPLNEEGIPKTGIDPEYLLKPINERIPPGIPRKFYERCLSKEWVNSELRFQPLNTMLSDEELTKDLETMTADVITKVKKKISSSRTAVGKQASFWLCFIPEGERSVGGSGLQAYAGDYERFWTDISKLAGVPLMDLTDPFLAFKPTSWPINEEGLGNHLNENGHLLWALILREELVQRKLIPF
jgi:sugar lactone lactonase YvrE